MDITHLSEQELKAFAYDTIQELDRHQQNLQVIRAELANRQTRTDAEAQTAQDAETRSERQGEMSEREESAAATPGDQPVE